jgi:hypothetical protein
VVFLKKNIVFGSDGFSDGTGADAQFNYRTGVVVDGDRDKERTKDKTYI